MVSRRHVVANLTCVECGKKVDGKWLEDNDIAVPLCPQCYVKFKQRFEESTPTPSEYTERCNLK